jgi:glycine oxidase
MHRDILIVGQGLAGTLLAHFCRLHGKSIWVIDNPEASKASTVAAGMFTPVSGKRMTKSWMAETLIPFAVETYKGLEQLLNSKLLKQQNVYQIFSSVKEQNDFSARLDQQEFAAYLNPSPQPAENTIEPYGAFEVNQSGWLNIPKLIEAFRHMLINESAYIQEPFVYNDLLTEGNCWHYHNLTFNHIVFCEGYYMSQNPYFAFIPKTPTKGEVLTIACEGLETARILKKGAYLVALGNNCYKVGATYDYSKELHNQTTDAGKEELIDKIKQITHLPFRILKHEAGIRPTTRDRKPILGEHPQHKNMHILNGLGTKGVMVGPWVAHKLVKNIFDKEPLLSEIRVSRFI